MSFSQLLLAVIGVGLLLWGSAELLWKIQRKAKKYPNKSS